MLTTERDKLKQQIAVLTTAIKSFQGIAKTDDFDPAEHCIEMHRRIAILERQLWPEASQPSRQAA